MESEEEPIDLSNELVMLDLKEGLRFVARGEEYKWYDSLAAARQNPRAEIWMQETSDYLSQWLECPVRLVRCTEPVLHQLYWDVDDFGMSVEHIIIRFSLPLAPGWPQRLPLPWRMRPVRWPAVPGMKLHPSILWHGLGQAVADVLQARAARLHEGRLNARACGPLAMTALHFASCSRIGLARALLKAGADVNATDLFRRTPLHYAAWADRPNLIRLLVAAGADVNRVDCEGCTPLKLAEGQPESIEVLRGFEAR